MSTFNFIQNVHFDSTVRRDRRRCELVRDEYLTSIIILQHSPADLLLIPHGDSLSPLTPPVGDIALLGSGIGNILNR